MKLVPSDFVNPVISGRFESQLPGASFLKNSVLDPALTSAMPGGSGMASAMVQAVANDTLRAQQYVVYDVARRIGVLAPMRDVVSSALQFVDVLRTDNTEEVEAQMALSVIGTATRIMSAVPNVYVQVAAAVAGFGVMLARLFMGNEKLPEHALPMQEYDEGTDQDQFEYRIRQALQEGVLTPLFLPRFRGDFTMQRRKDSSGRHGFAMALGNGKIGKGSEFRAHGLGFVPGGQQIMGIIQARFMEKPRGKKPFYETRCGGCTWSGGAKVLARDTGRFYPSSTNSMLALWGECLRPSPVMYGLATDQLAADWTDYFEAMIDGVRSAWGQGRHEDYWGRGIWRCMLSEVLRLTSTGFKDGIGAISAYSVSDMCEKRPFDADAGKGYLDQSVGGTIIQPAIAQMRYAQLYYLDTSTIAAYLEPGAPALSEAFMATRAANARERILQGPQKYEVRREDVADPAYAAELEARGAFVPAHQGTKKMTPTGPPGPGGPSEYGVYVEPLEGPPRPPPSPDGPKGGAPWTKPEAKKKRPKKKPKPRSSSVGWTLAAAGGLGALALVAANKWS